MALLASCWLLVESFVVPHGFLKWFYLSFYIHPFLLLFCQIFLWLKILFYPLTVAFRFVLSIFGLLQRVVFALFSYFSPSKDDDLFYDAFEPIFAQKQSQIAVDRSRVELVVFQRIRLYPIPHGEVPNHDICTSVNDSWLNEYLNSSCVASFHFYSMDEESSGKKSSQGFIQDSVTNFSTDHPLLLEDMIPNVSPFSCSDSNDSLSEADLIVDEYHGNSPVLQQQFIMRTYGEDTDQFHHKYTSRVRFFDVLYRERLQGINAILNEQLSSRRVGKRVLRSLECDLKMIDVAQCCLFWEALDHQYQRVESLSLSDNYGNIVVFHHDISGKFQELEIMLERFVDDQKSECQLSSSSSNATKRLSFQALLLVPDVTGFVLIKEEENKKMSEEYCIGSTKLLQVIQDCIDAFWSYIKTDEKKPFWKYKGILRSAYPPVEDPLDLKLLYDIVKSLHKKGIMLRNEEGKSKCWMRRKVKPFQGENEKRNLVGAMIDMKLVQTMLKMPSISRPHLKWCRDKLDKIDFKPEGVLRGRINQLFPLP